MRTYISGLWLAPCAALFLYACSCENEIPAAACRTVDECAPGEACVNGVCEAADAGEEIVLPGDDAGTSGPNINDPNNPKKDTDCDGLNDAEEFANTWGPDAKKTDPGNPDSDGDGILDGVEAGRTAGVAGTSCPALKVDADPAARTSPVEADTDLDGVKDGVEDADRDGKVDSGETDPGRPDTDGDGMKDGQEDENQNGKLEAGETDPLKADTDGDGCPDGYEDKNRNGKVDAGETDPLKAGDCVVGTLDTDGDGLPDSIEVNVTKTDPVKPDTDGDGLLDGEEDLSADGKLDPGETDPKSADTDCDGLGDNEEKGFKTDPRKADSDGDGVKDGVEVGRASSPASSCGFQGDKEPSSRTFPDKADTDGDGLSDGEEDQNADGRRDAAETDPRNPDTDGDGLSDGAEVDTHGTDPLKADSDGDGIPDRTELVVTKTNPAKADTDSDGCLDGEEDRNWNGVKDSGETSPKVAGDCKDSDCDGLRDDEEDVNGNGAVDPGETDKNRADTDGDTLSDGQERGVVRSPSPTLCPNFKGDSEPGSRTNPLWKDSDCDGLRDDEEDADGDGKVDAGETDPGRADTDGDGLTDGQELGRATNLDTVNCAGKFVADADPNSKTNPTKADSDGDGIPDGAEDLNQNGKVDPGELNPGTSDAGGAVTEACAKPRDVQQIDRFEADVSLAASPDFTQITTLTSGGKAVGAMLYDGTHKIAGFALKVSPLASVTAQEADGRAKLASVEPLDSSITQLFTTWDRYDAIGAWYVQQNGGNVDLKARINAAVEKFAPGVTGKLSGTAGVGGKFRVQAQYVRRSASHAVVIVAYVPDSLAGSGDNLFRLDDLANGTALAQFGDVSRPVCEKFASVAMPKVDFVWVVDNSGSMGSWQAEVANAADAMGQQLATAPIDWRIATIYSDTDRDQTRVHQPKPFTRSIAQFKSDAFPGTGGISPERGFAPVNYMFKTKWLPTATDDPNRLRTGAKVVIIWLTDTREQSVNGVCDNDWATSCHTLPDLYNQGTQLPAGYANWTAYFNNLPSMGKAFVAGIVPPVGEKMPGEETMTSEYRDVITALQGLEADMRDKAAMGAFMQQIIKAAIGNATQTKLARPPISASIKVAASQVSGANCNKNDMPRSRAHGFDYDGASKSLVFYGDCRPVLNQTVAVSYRYWVEQAPACNPPCEDPEVCDPVTGQCVCPSDCGGGCTGNKVCDLLACACACPPDCGGNLGPGQVCDPATCTAKCEQAVTCAQGFKFDAAACKCACDTTKLSCGLGMRPDPATCSCVCESDCGGCTGAETCSTQNCACNCGPASCPQHQYLDRTTCKCACDTSSLSCAPNKQPDAASCSCVCKSDCGGCPKGFTCDSSTCGCVCDTAALKCKATQKPDAASCSCVCKPDCGGCGFGTVCDQSTCSCKNVPT